jgi:hypothetical protein
MSASSSGTARGGGRRGDRSGLYLAIVLFALALSVYLMLQLTGFLLKLFVFVAVVLIAVASWRAWRSP